MPAATLISEHFGWRAGFVLVSALAAVAAVGVGALLPVVKGSTPPGRLSFRLTIVWRPAVLATLAVTIFAMIAAFSVLTYVRSLLEEFAGFGAGGVASMLFLFGLVGTTGSILGGFGADRFGYRTNVVAALVVLTFSLSAFSLLAVVGAAFATPVAAMALVALAPLQQYRLIRTSPDEQNGVLALNEMASDLGARGWARFSAR